MLTAATDSAAKSGEGRESQQSRAAGSENNRGPNTAPCGLPALPADTCSKHQERDMTDTPSAPAPFDELTLKSELL